MPYPSFWRVFQGKLFAHLRKSELSALTRSLETRKPRLKTTDVLPRGSALDCHPTRRCDREALAPKVCRSQGWRFCLRWGVGRGWKPGPQVTLPGRAAVQSAGYGPSSGVQCVTPVTEALPAPRRRGDAG